MAAPRLTRTQQTILEKARSPGASDMGVPLEDDTCAFLTATIARDLGHEYLFPDISWKDVPAYFDASPQPEGFFFKGDPETMLAVLFREVPDTDTYFSCLATLHKSRLKYERILRRQPLPSFDQVGPRGLLQYGTLSARALTALLYWRKWLYDIDNRAAQDTGYLFEPIIAHAIGGTPLSARKSPVRRKSDRRKGRQVDCLRSKKAYELKLRVTIAASGQGRWREELEFPVDCRSSGYTPILVVLDPTPNPKLDELQQAFEREGGQAYVGEDAWQHLEAEAGDTMSVFLATYVRGPLGRLTAHADAPLVELRLKSEAGSISISLGTEMLVIPREQSPVEEADDIFPDDIADDLPGV